MSIFTRFWRWLFPLSPPPEVVPPIVDAERAGIDVQGYVKSEPIPKRTYKPSIAPLRNAVEDEVTDIIERLTSLQVISKAEYPNKNELEESLSYLMGCDFHYVSKLAADMEGGSRFYHNYADPADAKELQEISWPVDIANITPTKNGSYNFNHMWTVTAAELRGKAKLYAPRMALLADGTLRTDGSWFAQLTPIGLINGRWVALDVGMERTVTDTRRGPRIVSRANSDEDRQQIWDNAMFMQSLALTERYSWHVALGQADGPRVLLPTNPQGCLALFRTRQRREGETRRAALRHWVEHHYREHGEREIAYVCDHLRGATEFLWRDFDCEIFVSQFDLEKNEYFKEQAKEWRAQRKHNRVRVKLKKYRT